MTPEQHRKEIQRRIEQRKRDGKRYTKLLAELEYWARLSLGWPVVRVKAETRRV
jgi:hypothetical protein